MEKSKDNTKKYGSDFYSNIALVLGLVGILSSNARTVYAGPTHSLQASRTSTSAPTCRNVNKRLV